MRRILTQSAKRLSPGDRDDSFGSGLIDPLKALQLADPRTATATTPSPAPTLRQRRGRGAATGVSCGSVSTLALSCFR